MSEKLPMRDKYLEIIKPCFDMDIIKVIPGFRHINKSVIFATIRNKIDIDEGHEIYANFENMDYGAIMTANSQ